MDSQQSTTERVTKLVQGKRFRAFGIACIVLSVLVVLQVGNLNHNMPMCELFGNCNLANNDLQRLQIALSQSGLSDFKVKDKQLLVPTEQHSEYLQAIAEKDAIPQELRDSDESGPSINPFLSRSQQLALQRAAKKRQIREMVVRLPFVEQAWFEMDQSETHSAFEAPKQSAVISIRPPENVPLNDQHVDTVKQMIGGAVADLNPANIVVIDLSAGFAHQDVEDSSTSQQVHYRRIAFEQQRFYESRIRETLIDYPGIKVTVHVEVKPDTESDKLTLRQPQTIHTAQFPQRSKVPNAGANGVASVQDFEPSLPTVDPQTNSSAGYRVELASHAEMMPTDSLQKEIFVSINVPQKLVNDLFGSVTIERSEARSHSQYQTMVAKDTQVKFQQLQAEIIQKVRPLLPASTFQNRATSPIAVNLIRQPLPTENPWTSEVQQFAIQHWPSVAVLLIGVILLTIVTRNPETLPASSRKLSQNETQDIVSIDAHLSNERVDQNPEVRLSNLIEKDPDAAAKVIEAWIRDAA